MQQFKRDSWYVYPLVFSTTSQFIVVFIQIIYNVLLLYSEYPELYLVEDYRKLEYAKHLKALGVEDFKNENVVEAFQKFGDALKLLVLLDGKRGVPVPENVEKTKRELKLTLYNNLAGCQVKRSNWEYVIDLCNSVLEKDPDNVKALYRRGWARLECEVRNFLR